MVAQSSSLSMARLISGNPFFGILSGARTAARALFSTPAWPPQQAHAGKP
jgi:hypothetical protein